MRIVSLDSARACADVRKIVEGKNYVSFFIEIMSNLNLFVAGSIHQGSERFSDVSHVRQCSFMSFSALLFAQTLPIVQWTASKLNVDQFQLMRVYRTCNCGCPEDYPSTQDVWGRHFQYLIAAFHLQFVVLVVI